MLDGLSQIGPLLDRARELGMDSVGLTDHGGMYGAIDFYRRAGEVGVKPIIGCEMYVAPGSRHSRSPNDKTPFHATVLARDNVGYANLVKLVSKAHLEGFYYKPRIDRELIEAHSEGLVFLSGCPSGEVPGLIAQGRVDEARDAAGWYSEVFPDYYLELMQHGGVPELPAINAGLMELHRDLSIPIVATNDSHYVRREDAPLQDIRICIHTNTNVNDEGRLRMTEDSYYLKSPQEMEALFSETPAAVTNTLAIAEKCNVELDFSAMRLPEFRLPDGVTADHHLARLAWEGLKGRLRTVTETEEKRLAYELEVIKQTRYANYCLVVWDIARFVRERNIFFAVRGSAAGSLALFALGITDVNPLEHDMIFERFLNVERNEMPDVDMDFQDDRREEVINYVVSKYGREHVAQIITFGTLGAKASIRDVGRALAMPYAEVDRVARLVPYRLHVTLDQAMEENEELKDIYEADESIRKLMDTARGLEGLIRHSSTHAAGVVISRDPVDQVVPLQRPIKSDDDAVNMTQYSMGPIEALGFMKMDFLGLANLTVLAKTIDLISKTRGVDIVLRDIPLDDTDTFATLSRGETGGVFQLEGAGMTRHIKELMPSSLNDVAAMIALYRPGPMEHIETFIDRKHGRSEPDYPHPALREILEETYGVIVYQDQVLQIARVFAGYSMGEADIVRKAMGKKIPAIMAQEEEKFISGALAQGYPDELAHRVFDLIEPFAGYAFAKPHAVSYGLISYWTAYLKTHYPAEYMVSLLNSYVGNADRVTGAVEVCRRLNIQVYPPDVNRGEAEFSISEGRDGRACILFGMAAVKGVGAAAVECLTSARKKDGPFTSLEHMCRVADLRGLNKRTIESLIMAGAFDAWGDRGALLEVADRIIGLAQSEAARRDSDQTSMFDLFGESVPTPLTEIGLPDVETSDSRKSQWEREVLGLPLSGNSLLAIPDPGSGTVVFRYDLNADMEGRKVVVRGQVSSTIDRFTRNGRPFTIATLTLMDGELDVFVWEEERAATRGLWEQGKMVEVVGTVRARDDQISISCKEATEYVPPSSDESEDTGADTQAEYMAPPPQVAGGTPVEVPQAAGGAPVEASQAAGGTPVEASQSAAGAAVEASQAAGRAPVEAPQAAGGAPVEAPQAAGGAPVEAPQAAGGAHVKAPQARPASQNGSAAVGGDRSLNVRLRETGRAREDQALLDDVLRLLMDHLGDDDVKLEIATEGKLVTLRWPTVRVDASPDLEQRLLALLGTSGTASIEVVSP